MSRPKDTVKFNRLDSQIWKRSKIDSKGRTVLPIKLRKKLELNGKSEILWISAKQVDGKSNEYIIEVGVKR